MELYVLQYRFAAKVLTMTANRYGEKELPKLLNSIAIRRIAVLFIESKRGNMPATLKSFVGRQMNDAFFFCQ